MSTPNELTQQRSQHVTLPPRPRLNAAVQQGLHRAPQDLAPVHHDGRHPLACFPQPLQSLPAKPAIQARAQRVDDVADLHPIQVELGAVAGDVPIRPGALRVQFHEHPIGVVEVPPGRTVGVDGDGVGGQADRAQEIHPKANAFRNGPLSEREQAQHVEIEAVNAIANLVEIRQAQAALDVGQYTGVARVREEPAVLLHPRRGEQRGVIGGKNAAVNRKRQVSGAAELLEPLKNETAQQRAWRSDMASSGESGPTTAVDLERM